MLLDYTILIFPIIKLIIAIFFTHMRRKRPASLIILFVLW